MEWKKIVINLPEPRGQVVREFLQPRSHTPIDALTDLVLGRRYQLLLAAPVVTPIRKRGQLMRFQSRWRLSITNLSWTSDLASPKPKTASFRLAKHPPGSCFGVRK